MKSIITIIIVVFFITDLNSQSSIDTYSILEVQTIDSSDHCITKLKKADIFNSRHDLKLKSYIPEMEPEDDNRGILFGISAGLNAGTRFYNFTTIPNPSAFSIRLAPSFGFTLGYQFGNTFSLQSSLKYQGKGDKINVSDWLEKYPSPETFNAVWEYEANGSITTSLHYIEASLLPVFGIGNYKNGIQIQLGIGGFAAYGLSGIEDNNYWIEYYLDHNYDSEEIVNNIKLVEFVSIFPSSNSESYLYYNTLDYGLLLYSGVRYKKLNFGIHFSWGMKELEYKSYNFGYWILPIDTSKTATTTFSFTYFF